MRKIVFIFVCFLFFFISIELVSLFWLQYGLKDKNDPKDSPIIYSNFCGDNFSVDSTFCKNIKLFATLINKKNFVDSTITGLRHEGTLHRVRYNTVVTNNDPYVLRLEIRDYKKSNYFYAIKKDELELVFRRKNNTIMPLSLKDIVNESKATLILYQNLIDSKSFYIIELLD